MKKNIDFEKLFQFLLVRLRDNIGTAKNGGTIFISIPSGAIKRVMADNDNFRILIFQFLLVRLRDKDSRRLST